MQHIRYTDPTMITSLQSIPCIGEKTPKNFDAMKKAVDKAAALAVEKKSRIVERLKGLNTFMIA